MVDIPSYLPCNSKVMKIRFFALVILAIVYCKCFGQDRFIDSLKNELSQHQPEDSVRVKLLNRLAFELHFNQPAPAAKLCLWSRYNAEKINYPEGRAQSYRCLGLTFWAQSNLSTALNYFVKGLKIADSIGSQQAQADITGNIGLVYSGMSNYATSLKYYNASMIKQRQLKNLFREAVMLNNVGDCYLTWKKYDSALISYRTHWKWANQKILA